MANSPSRSNLVANTAADAACALANSGKLRIYDGIKPTNADTAVGSQVLLAELTMNATAFAAAAGGVATANAITADPSANATGIASWFRIVKSDGVSVLWDGTVGGSGCDLNLGSTSITAGNSVTVTSFTYTATK